MADEYKRPLSELRTRRSSILEILILAVALGLGVNLAASLLTEITSLLTSAIVALCLVPVLLALYAVVALRPRTWRDELKAVVVTRDRLGVELLTVPGYGFSEDITTFAKAVFAENAAFERQWKAEPLGQPLEVIAAPTRVESVGSFVLLRELVEYALLFWLDLHVGSYFERAGAAPIVSENELVALKREDIPEIVFSNRVLQLISQDVGDRAACTSRDAHEFTTKSGQKFMAIPISSGGKGGELYNRFKVTLPRGSRITRSDDGFLQVIMPHLTITLEVDFRGFGGVLPPKFRKSYLGLDTAQGGAWQVQVDVQESGRAGKLASLALANVTMHGLIRSCPA